MTTDAEEFAVKYLKDFKERMHITYDEDDNLLRLLASSVAAVAKLVGATAYDETLVELTFERAMCAFNDALDEFKTLYAEEIEDLYLTNMIVASEEAKDDS